MKMHPVYTRAIVRTIAGFEQLAFVAAAHHERLDGKGYPDGLTATHLPLTARILCVADVYQALTEKRPYREPMAEQAVFALMEKDAPSRLDPQCLDVLKQNSARDAQQEAAKAKAASAR
jgi:HD-GYP domain-containing protein (c-di-GMP phosphodiesterase class II)